MLLSVGYGPDEAGRITMNFGPLNQDGGWRRLNVLVTRARLRCEVFTSLTPERLRIDTGTPRGVVALRNYLHYASTGSHLDLLSPRGDHQSPFEAEVARRLRDLGWTVDAQIGSAGFWIDLGIVDPRAPGRYLAGIECDGATYHSAATARDRDRLRQSVLERLGWRIERLWSTDFFLQPQSTIDRLHNRLRALLDESPGPTPRRPAPPSPQAAPHAPPEHAHSATGAKPRGDRPEERAAPGTASARAVGRDDSHDPPTALPPGIEPYRRHAEAPRGDRSDLLRTPARTLASLVERIARAEGPVHENEIVRIICGLYGGCRATGEALDRVRQGITAAAGAGSISLRTSFLWPKGMTTPPVRDRTGPDAVTDPELIAPEEWAHAAAWVVRHEFGVPRDDLPAAVVRRLGFRRGGTRLLAAAERGVTLAIESGLIRPASDGLLQAPEQSE